MERCPNLEGGGQDKFSRFCLEIAFVAETFWWFR